MVRNLTEYLNRNYVNDEKLEQVVSTMTKTLYNPEVERQGRYAEKLEIAKRLILKGMDMQTISEITRLSLDEIKRLNTSN